MPLLAVTVVLESGIIPWVSGLSLVFLTLLGGLAAYVGGANILWVPSASPSGVHWRWRRQASGRCSERRSELGQGTGARRCRSVRSRRPESRWPQPSTLRQGWEARRRRHPSPSSSVRYGASDAPPVLLHSR